MMRAVILGLIRLLTGVNIRWTGCAPEQKQRIYFANHTSNLDGPVIWAALPDPIRHRTHLVAAHDYWTATAARRYLASRVFSTVLIERRNITVRNNPLTLLLRDLDNGFSLIIFPEGGRSRDGTLLPFKSGLYHLGVKRPDVELIPVKLDNMNRILPKGDSLPVPLLACLSFGAPLRVDPGENRNEFLRRAENAILRLEGAGG